MPSGWTITHYRAFWQPIIDYGTAIRQKYLPLNTGNAQNFIDDWEPANDFRKAALDLEKGNTDFSRLPIWVEAGISYNDFRKLEVRGWCGYYHVISPTSAIGILSLQQGTLTSGALVQKIIGP
jgi:hypothetical protein